MAQGTERFEYDGIPCSYPELVLASVVRRAGFAGLARCVPDWKPGLIEARLNEALAGVSFAERPDDWFRIKAARDVARRIRKPLNSDEEYFRDATWALCT